MKVTAKAFPDNNLCNS